MSKYDYLHALYQALGKIDATIRNKIMRDIEDQFRIAEEKGLPETFVTDPLGTPETYASTIFSKLKKEQEYQQIHTTEHMAVGDVDLQIIHTITHALEANDSSVLSTQDNASNQNADVLFSDMNLPANDTTFTQTVPPESEDTPSPVSDPTVTSISDSTPAPVIDSKPAPVFDSKPTTVSTLTSVSTSTSVPVVGSQSLINTPTQKINPRSSSIQKRGNSPLVSILVACGLAFFNLTFILGPFIALWAVIFSFATVGIAFSFSGALIIFSGIFSIPLPFVSVPLVVMGHPTLLFATGFLLVGTGGLLTIFMIYSVRFCGMMTGKYAGWNIRLIRGY